MLVLIFKTVFVFVGQSRLSKISFSQSQTLFCFNFDFIVYTIGTGWKMKT